MVRFASIRRASFIAYFLVIFVGAVALRLPISRASHEEPITALDAAFTATSATCVTGLAVRSTGGDYSWFGQLIILLLIQIGGLGILTITTFVAFYGGGGRAGLRERAVVAETLGIQEGNLVSILRRVVTMTLLFEGIGFAILAIRNLFDMPVGPALWHALFHSISAYCNAGFGLLDDSLTRYQGDVVVNLTICSLVIIGGIGVPVLLDLRRSRKYPWKERWRRLALHSKIMLLGSSILLLAGFVSILALEWDGVMKNMSAKDCVLTAMFQSVATRTAGFNTVKVASLTNATLYVMVLLMIVGAGPCSTAGGIQGLVTFCDCCPWLGRCAWISACESIWSVPLRACGRPRDCHSHDVCRGVGDRAHDAAGDRAVRIFPCQGGGPLYGRPVRNCFRPGNRGLDDRPHGKINCPWAVRDHGADVYRSPWPVGRGLGLVAHSPQTAD